MRIAVAGATGVVGRHVLAAAARRDHHAVPLSRASGVDLVTGAGLVDALAGVDVVIDAANAGTTDETAATAFFRAAATHLQAAGATHHVDRIVTLSIVGIDAVPFGYYAAKLAHERAALDGPVPAAILRATQFHEFAAQLIAATRTDDRASVLDLTVQSVAARDVGEALVDAAEASPTGRLPDVGGPRVASLVDQARALVAHRHEHLEVLADRETVAGLPARALLPGPDARLIGPQFTAWLDTEDAAALSLGG